MHPLSISETPSPIRLSLPREGQELSPTEDSSINQPIQQDHGVYEEVHMSNEPVVTSHGKACLWCMLGSRTDKSDNIQEEQHDKGYEDGDGNNNYGSEEDTQAVDLVREPLPWENISGRSPRPDCTNGSTVVHPIVPGLFTRFLLQFPPENLQNSGHESPFSVDIIRHFRNQAVPCAPEVRCLDV
jgi:hypothetical protein